MKRYVSVLLIFMAVITVGCSRFSEADLNNTQWASRRVTSDPSLGSVELTFLLTFYDRKTFSLKRMERWVKKLEGINMPLPEDQESAGEYRVQDKTIRLMWEDDSLNFSYRDGKIYNHDESIVFTRTVK